MFRQYKKTQVAEMRPYVAGEDMAGISVSFPDMNAGSPKLGDMIARNPVNHKDLWLVASEFFMTNYEPVS